MKAGWSLTLAASRLFWILGSLFKLVERVGFFLVHLYPVNSVRIRNYSDEHIVETIVDYNRREDNQILTSGPETTILE